MPENVQQGYIPKEAAGYTSPSPVSSQCGNCVMFRSGSCDLVAGIIEQGAVCRYWEPEEEV